MRITVAGGDTRELKLDRGGRAFSYVPGCVEVADDALHGPQPGHKGHSSAMLEESEVDRLVDYNPTAMCECDGQFELVAASQRHLVFDIPPMRTSVDDYRLYSGRCADCGKARSGVLAAGVPKGRFGPCAPPLIRVLDARYHLTQRKIRRLPDDRLLDEFVGLSLSVGAISQAHGEVAYGLKTPDAEAAPRCSADEVRMGETHYPRAGIANWARAAVQPLLTVFAIYP